MDKDKLMERARDELFSHINRCGVLQAAPDDQQHWMDETIDYLAERYPDLNEVDLVALQQVGMRFCQPAIPHGAEASAKNRPEQETPEGAEVTEAEPADANAAA